MAPEHATVFNELVTRAVKFGYEVSYLQFWAGKPMEDDEPHQLELWGGRTTGTGRPAHHFYAQDFGTILNLMDEAAKEEGWPT